MGEFFLVSSSHILFYDKTILLCINHGRTGNIKVDYFPVLNLKQFNLKNLYTFIHLIEIK